jgi:hypothetical protein
MSDTRPEQDRNEATVVPVRRPQPVAETTAVQARPFPVGKALIGIASVVLLAVLAFVLVYLPNRVEQARLIEAVQQESVPAPTVPAPATPRLTADEREALRAEAEDLRFSLLEQQEELNARSAESWGASTWEAYQAELRRGDDALLAEDLPRAVEQYQTALATGEQLFASSRTIMANAQAAGEAAIDAGNPELAMTQFSIVLAVEPENRDALRGQRRAAALPDLLDAMRRGDQARRQGEL